MEFAKQMSKARREVLQAFEVTEDDVNGYIEELKDWLKKQPHLPAALLEDDLLERFLVKNKFSIEKTKTKIENYCSLRKKYKKFYLNYEEIIPTKESATPIPMVPLTDDLNRIVICKVWDDKKFDCSHSLRMVFLMLELESRLDYSCGNIFVVDFSGNSSALLTKINFFLLKDALTLALKAYSARVKAVHIINCPKFIEIFMSLVKTILPKKIFGRIMVHNDLCTLYEHVPKSCLPSDYGGTLEPLRNILKYYDQVFEESQEVFKKAIQIESNEKLSHQNYLPVESFRKLQID